MDNLEAEACYGSSFRSSYHSFSEPGFPKLENKIPSPLHLHQNSHLHLQDLRSQQGQFKSLYLYRWTIYYLHEPAGVNSGSLLFLNLRNYFLADKFADFIIFSWNLKNQKFLRHIFKILTICELPKQIWTRS